MIKVHAVYKDKTQDYTCDKIDLTEGGFLWLLTGTSKVVLNMDKTVEIFLDEDDES